MPCKTKVLRNNKHIGIAIDAITSAKFLHLTRRANQCVYSSAGIAGVLLPVSLSHIGSVSSANFSCTNCAAHF